MEYAKFLLCGQDRKTLAGIKNLLTQNGHIFIGYSREPANILRHVRTYTPEILVIEVENNFNELTGTLEVIDEELLAACILLLNNRNSSVFEFLGRSRAITYVAKPVFDEVLVQITDITLANFRRICEYEAKVKKLNETLESRRLVEKAKWILVEQEKVTEAEAYELIRKKSRDNRMAMREIAEAIILTRSG
jgi:response regulator NasT